MNPNLWTPTYIKKKPLSSPSCGAMKKFFSLIPLNKKPETLRKEHPGNPVFPHPPGKQRDLLPQIFPLPFANAQQLPVENHPNGLPLGSAAFRPLITRGSAFSIQRILLHRDPNLCKRKIAKMKIFGRNISCSILLSRRPEL